MKQKLFDPTDIESREAPDFIIEKAVKQDKKILKIEYDQGDGYARNHTSWSVRPYTPGYGCDGTTDMNIHLIGLRLCSKLGLDYFKLYEKAYAWQGVDAANADWLRNMDWSTIEEQTEIPEVSEESVNLLLLDLQEINNRSLMILLATEFHKLGFNVNGMERLADLENDKAYQKALDLVSEFFSSKTPEPR